MNIEKIDEKIILELIGVILIEMRSHENKNYAPIMADVLHHAPGMLIKGISANIIYHDMISVASRHGVDGYISSLLNSIMPDDNNYGDGAPNSA